jgi:hypothetical protein
MCEFDCEGCGVHVVAFDIIDPSAHGFCASCAWLCEHVPDPVEMMECRLTLGVHRYARNTAETTW